jgi:chromosome segregation ATPase
MDTFKKIRSGITELKKEKEELKNRYEFLAGELGRLVQANKKEIKSAGDKAIAASEGLSAVGESTSRLEDKIGEVEDRLSASVSALEKHSDDFKKALIEVGERIQQAQGSADDAKDGVKDNKEQDKSLTKYIDDMQKRISGLEALREKINEIEKAGDVLVKGVQDLEDLRGSVAGFEEKLAALESSEADKAALIESKLSSGIDAVKKGNVSNTSALKGLDSAMKKTALDLNALKKDLAVERVSIGRVRASAASNRKKLELLGTLQTQIKNIQDIKTGLVKEVASIKDMKNNIVVLGQKTRDLDARLTNADKALDLKLQEKASGLGKQIAEKTKGMESQMQERLKFLESNLTEKGKTLETKLVDMGRQLEGTTSAKLAAIGKEMGKGTGDIRGLKSDLQKMSVSLKNLKNGLASSRSEILDAKKQASSISSRVTSLEEVRERVKVIEDSKNAFDAGMASLAKVKEGLGILVEKSKNLDARISGETGALRAEFDESIALLKAGQAATRKKVSSLDALRQKTRDIEQLEKSLSASLREIKPVQMQVAAAMKDMASMRQEMDNADAVLESKLDYNVTSLKKEAGFNSASVKKLEEEMKGLSLEIRSMRKDQQAGGRDMTETKGALEKSQRKLAELEKLQIRLKEMENTKDALGSAMDAQLHEKMKFIETNLRQKSENIEKGLQEKARASAAKLTSDINALGKELSGKSSSIEKLKSKLDAIGRLEEKIEFIDVENDEIAKSVAALGGLHTSLAGMEERGKNLEKGVREIKSSLVKEVADLRGQVDSAKTGGRDKFDTAVKAFLNTRGELNSKMNGLNVKLSELEKRMNDFSRSLIRIDLVEKKMDRLSERSTEIRRDMDDLERKKEEPSEKVMLVDLEKEAEES